MHVRKMACAHVSRLQRNTRAPSACTWNASSTRVVTCSARNQGDSCTNEEPDDTESDNDGVSDASLPSDSLSTMTAQVGLKVDAEDTMNVRQLKAVAA